MSGKRLFRKSVENFEFRSEEDELKEDDEESSSGIEEDIHNSKKRRRQHSIPITSDEQPKKKSVFKPKTFIDVHSGKKPKLKLSSSAPQVLEQEHNDNNSDNMDVDTVATTPTTSIIDSYIGLNAKNTSKIKQPLKEPVFLLKPYRGGPISTSSIDPVLSDSKKLIGNSALLDSSQSIQTTVRKTAEVVKENPDLKPRTRILDNISDLTTETKIQKKNVSGSPGLIALNVSILPNFHESKEQAKRALDDTITKTIGHKVISLAKDDLTIVTDGKPTETTQFGGTTLTTTTHQESNTSQSSSLHSGSEKWLKTVNATFSEVMEKITEDFYRPDANVQSISDVYDREYIKETLKGSFKEPDTTTPSYVKSNPSNIPLHRNPNLRIPQPGQITIDIPKLSRLYQINFLRAAALPGERPCKNDTRCEGYTRWHHFNTNSPISKLNHLDKVNPHKIPEGPFPLREFFLPKEMKEILDEKKSGKTYAEILKSRPNKICLLCLRLTIQVLVDHQKAGIEKISWFHVQNHANIFDAPGEYKREYQKGSNSEWCGNISSILTYDGNHYVPGNYYVIYVEKKEKDSDIESTVYSQTHPIKTDDSGDMSQEVTSFISEMFGTQEITYKVVPGFLEKEEIIFRPEIQNSQVKNLINTASRTDLFYGLTQRDKLLTRTVFLKEYTLLDQITSYFGIPENLFQKPINQMQNFICEEKKLPSAFILATTVVGPLLDLFSIFYKFHQIQTVGDENVLYTDTNKNTLHLLEKHKTEIKNSFISAVEEAITSNNLYRFLDYMETFNKEYKLWYEFIPLSKIISWIKTNNLIKDITTNETLFPSSLKNSSKPIINRLQTSQPQTKFDLPVDKVILIVSTYLYTTLMLNIPRQFFSFITIHKRWTDFIPNNKSTDTFISTLIHFLKKPFLNSKLITENTPSTIDCFYASFQEINETQIDAGPLKIDDLRIVKYMISIIRTWDNNWLPLVRHLKLLLETFSFKDILEEETQFLSMGISKAFSMVLTKIKNSKGEYCGEMGIWVNLVYNFNITYPTLMLKKNTPNEQPSLVIFKKPFKSPLRYMESNYQFGYLSCIDFLDLARDHLTNLLPYPEKIRSFKHPFFYIPFFDETQEAFHELDSIFFKHRSVIDNLHNYEDTITHLLSLKDSSEYQKLSDKAKILFYWLTTKQWLKTHTAGFNDLFLISEGKCYLDPLPKLSGYIAFWSFFYCLHRLCFMTTLIRTDLFVSYQNIFITKGIRKMGIYTWEKQINTTYLELGHFFNDKEPNTPYGFNLNSIFDDRLDLNIQRYLTCFLDLTDWFLEFLRPNQEHTFRERKPREEISDKHTPIFMFYPHPSKDLMPISVLDIGMLFQHMRLWHDTPSIYLAIVVCFEKAISCRSKKRSIGKKMYDCCEESYGMTKYIKNMVMLIFMGLISRQYILNFKDKHYGLPTIFRPNFASVYWLWRLFFDRKFSDKVYRYNYKLCETNLKRRTESEKVDTGINSKPKKKIFHLSLNTNDEKPLTNYSPYTDPPQIIHGRRQITRGRGRGKRINTTQHDRVNMRVVNETDDNVWNGSINDPRLYAFYPLVHDFPASFQSRQKIYEAKKDEQFVKILLSEELKFREVVYKNREDALIPISNDLLCSFLHQESDLANDIIKEFLVQYLSSQPQFWLKSVTKEEYNQMNYADNMIETRWKTYFTKTTLMNNILRFNIDTCVHSITKHIIQTGFYKKIKPWEMDTLISCGLRTLNNQNKITRQFTNFFDNNVYTFRKTSTVSALHTQLDFFMEGIIKKSVSLEQEIYDLQFVTDELLPLLSNIPQEFRDSEIHVELIIGVKNTIAEILCKNGLKTVNEQFYTFLDDKQKNLELQKLLKTIITKERITKHKYLNRPLNEELRYFIWNTVFRNSTPENPYDPSVIKNIMCDPSIENPVEYIFKDILTKSERLFLFKIIKLEEDQVSSKKITKLLSLLPNPIPSFKKLHFIVETIYSAYNLQTTPLDTETVEKIHNVMVTKRFKLIPGMPVNYQNIYRAIITHCCNRVASLGKNNTLYGHFYVSFDPNTQMLVCNKKKSKKMNYVSFSATGANSQKNTNTNKVQITDEDRQTYIDSGLDVTEFISASNLKKKVQQGNNTKNLSTEMDDEIELQAPIDFSSSTDDNFFFSYILKSNKMGVVLVEAPQTNFNLNEESSLRDFLKNLKEYTMSKRFAAFDEKDQNKIARRLKKIRHPDCINNPPVICIDIFAKRIFYGKDEKNRKIYQTCTKCGNFTLYQDENWTYEYACFNCWLKDFYIHCRCTYCHSSVHRVFNDHNNMPIVPNMSVLTDDLLKKERAKRISDILKSQRRDRIIHECMRMPQFPICINGLTKTQRHTVMKKELGMAKTIISSFDEKESAFNGIYNNWKDGLTNLTISRKYVDMPNFFSAYFCPAHRPLNPINITLNVGEASKKYNESNFNALSNTGAIRTFMVNSSNFNVNNQYRISFVSPFFELLRNKKKKDKKKRL